MKSLLIKNGKVVNPACRKSEILDILIEDGKIIKIEKDLNLTADTVFDAKDKIVTPGLIDLHVHFREPGFEEKETIKSGAAAAARGGFTAVVTMPNTKPPVDNETVVNFILDAAKDAKTTVYPVGCISHKMQGESLAEIGLMKKAGIVAISEDGFTVMNSKLMKNALRYTLIDDLLTMSHCEDMDLAKGGAMNEGEVSSSLGLPGIPKAAEEIIISRDIMLAKDTNARIHISHVSTKDGVEIIRRAKAEGVKVTAETAPHYFTLTHEVIRTFNTNCKMNPPLREQSDLEAIIEGIKDGTLDAIATDHAPHTLDDKDCEFDRSPNGVVGLETSLGVTLTELVHKNKISIEKMVDIMSVRPAQILKVEGGKLEVGVRADITIIDLNKKWTVDSSKFHSKARNTPFEGKELVGDVLATINGGVVVYENR